MSMLQNNCFMATARPSKKDAVGKLLSARDARVTLEIGSFDSYTFLVLSNLPHPYIRRQAHANPGGGT